MKIRDIATIDRPRVVYNPENLGMVVIIFGPQTRLGQALTEWAQRHRYDLIFVARHAYEAAWITDRYPWAPTVLAWQDNPIPIRPFGRVTIFGCAFGVDRQREPSFLQQMKMAERDVHTLTRIVQTYAAIDVQILLIASVSPPGLRPGRRTDRAWESIARAAVQSTAAHRSENSLSLVYHGRLVEKRRWTRPRTVLATSYRDFAERLGHSARHSENSRAIVGWDARIWLITRGVGVALQAMVGKGPRAA